MTTTVKRIHLGITKEDEREIKALCNHFNENTSQVIKRAIILLNYITFYTGDNNVEKK
jgi:hypothetical protein